MIAAGAANLDRDGKETARATNDEWQALEAMCWSVQAHAGSFYDYAEALYAATPALVRRAIRDACAIRGVTLDDTTTEKRP